MATKRTAGRGAVLFGLFVVLAGLAGAVVLYLLSGQRGDEAIEDLARAPVGCRTTMNFKDTGTFYVYIEHLGRLDTLDGDCRTPEEYSRDADQEPRVTITLTDGTGSEVDLDRLEDQFTYSADSFAGTATRQVEIESTGDYVVTVESDDGDDFVVAIGRDPGDAGNTMRLGALAAGVAGIVLGLGLVLVGVRRGRRWRRVDTAYIARPPGSPAAGPIPTAPPMMQPPLAQRVPASQQPGQWSAAPPVAPPILSPEQPPPPPGPYTPDGQPTSGAFAPPRVFAPPAMPTHPAIPPTLNPIAPPIPTPPGEPLASPDQDRDGAPGDLDGDFRGDASR